MKQVLLVFTFILLFGVMGCQPAADKAAPATAVDKPTTAAGASPTAADAKSASDKMMQQDPALQGKTAADQ